MISMFLSATAAADGMARIGEAVHELAALLAQHFDDVADTPTAEIGR